MPIITAILEKRSPGAPLLYGISNRALFPHLEPLQYLERLFRTRVDIVQWREKDLNRRQNRPLVRKGVELAASTGKAFLLNSDWEMALEEGAHGVHLTSVQDVRSCLQACPQGQRGDFLVGKSVHSLGEALAAQQEGVDYIMLGPVFDPTSKPAAGRALGLKRLRRVVRRIEIPVFAVGGIDSATIAQVLSCGAAGAAGISWAAREIEKLLED